MADSNNLQAQSITKYLKSSREYFPQANLYKEITKKSILL